MRDELLNLEEFTSLRETKMLAETWRRDYNHYRPHSGLGYQTPVAFALRQAGCRQPERAAGYNPQGYVRFMEKLADLEGRSPSTVGVLLSTHPPSGDRLRRLREQLALLLQRSTEEARHRYLQQMRGL